MMDKVENLFPGAYMEFLARYPKGLADAQFKPDNRTDNDEYLFVSIMGQQHYIPTRFFRFPKLSDAFRDCRLFGKQRGRYLL